MRVLYIAPVPPPISGHSLASKVFYDYLKERHEVKIVNLSKTGFKNGIDSVSRIFQVVSIVYAVWKNNKNVDVIYLTISESLAGNIKDILIYLVSIKKINKVVIHLHGGSIRKKLFDKNKLVFSINKYFLKRIAGVVLLGKSHLPIFSDIVERNRISIVPNFAEDDIFSNEEDVLEKFSSPPVLNIIFLSNLIYGKGYEELVAAFNLLDEKLKSLIRIEFAGGFESEEEKTSFLKKIANISQINYRGVVMGADKREFLHRAHVFCLPTKLNEGQPISILEAYAAGCVVVTTEQGGIPDIFTHEVNGFRVDVDSAQSITHVLERLAREREILASIGIKNLQLARERYRIGHFNHSLLNIIERVN